MRQQQHSQRVHFQKLLTAVADAEALCSDTPEEGLSTQRAVQRHVANDDVGAWLKGAAAWRVYCNCATRQTLRTFSGTMHTCVCVCVCVCVQC
jgi:hypothetical protein